MRLYRYAASKDELLDAVVELVLSELEVSSPTADDWEEVLRRTARRFRGIVLAHPKVVPLLVTRPLATRLALRPIGRTAESAPSGGRIEYCGDGLTRSAGNPLNSACSRTARSSSAM